MTLNTFLRKVRWFFHYSLYPIFINFWRILIKNMQKHPFLVSYNLLSVMVSLLTNGYLVLYNEVSIFFNFWAKLLILVIHFVSLSNYSFIDRSNWRKAQLEIITALQNAYLIMSIFLVELFLLLCWDTVL